MADAPQHRACSNLRKRFNLIVQTKKGHATFARPFSRISFRRFALAAPPTPNDNRAHAGQGGQGQKQAVRFQRIFPYDNVVKLGCERADGIVRTSLIQTGATGEPERAEEKVTV